MNKTIKKWMFILGIVGLVSGWMLFTYTWFQAYFNGYKILITINDYGEAIPELIMQILLLPFTLYVLVRTFKIENERVENIQEE